MIYLGVLLGLAIMSAMVYMALDKKSSFLMRIACLIALALMIVTIIVCLILVFTDNSVPVDESVLIVGAPVEVKEKGGNSSMVLLLLIIFLLAIFALIAFFALRENRRQRDKANAKADSGVIL